MGLAKHSLRENRRRNRVLLVEDNLVNQKLTMRLLEKRDFEVAIAGDGKFALDLLEKESFDLVLMDAQMPNMDGFEATTAIREKEKSTRRHIPIIAMTAHALKGDEERCIATGMDAYISKPIRTNELFTTVEKFLDKSEQDANRTRSDNRTAHFLLQRCTGHRLQQNQPRLLPSAAESILLVRSYSAISITHRQRLESTPRSLGVYLLVRRRNRRGSQLTGEGAEADSR